MREGREELEWRNRHSRNQPGPLVLLHRREIQFGACLEMGTVVEMLRHLGTMKASTQAFTIAMALQVKPRIQTVLNMSLQMNCKIQPRQWKSTLDIQIGINGMRTIIKLLCELSMSGMVSIQRMVSHRGADLELQNEDRLYSPINIQVNKCLITQINWNSIVSRIRRNRYLNIQFNIHFNTNKAQDDSYLNLKVKF
jgi:hypothetical protein